MVSVNVTAGSKKPSIDVDFPGKSAGQVTVADLKRGIEAKFPKLPVVRQRLTIPSTSTGGDSKPSATTVLSDDHATLASYGVKESGTTVRCKDLGPQIGWSTVFLAEYAGPMIIHPILYYLSSARGLTLPYLLHRLGLPSSISLPIIFTPSLLQTTVCALVVLHFAKREYETLYVHRFSHATMPFRNIFKNCGHYWALSGLLLGLSIYRSSYSAKALQGKLINSPTWIAAWTAVWVFGELSNYITHMNLRSIRTPPGQPRKFPRGYGFNGVTCANYFFEAVSWLALCGMTGGDVAVVFFTLVSTLQMMAWADKKHRTYKKEHGKNYPRRARMFPLLF